MGNKYEADVRAFNTALGRVLKAQRVLRGKGQADMVDDDARLSLASVGRIERGAGATTVQLISLARALGMPLSGFIGAVEDEARRATVPAALATPELRRHPEVPLAAEAAAIEVQAAHARERSRSDNEVTSEG